MSDIPAIDWPVVQRPGDLRRIVLWSAVELSSAIRGRVVSCVEVMTAYLDHIDVVNPRVNALVAIRPRAELLAQAAAKDLLLDEGVDEGWMHGFPQAIKDLAEVAGWTTSFGFFGDADELTPAEHDDLFVSRIRAAGAIFIGRTNTPEFGLGSHTYNTVYGTTRNAYDQSRTAGGSSGGAAVAVALRMLPVADGSDFMGSLRNPPGWNGVLGMRPSFGRVPSAGGDQFTLHGGVEGPIARSAQDLALLLDTMAGYDPRSPLSIHAEGEELAAIAPVEASALRIGWIGDLGGYFAVEPEVLAVIRSALGRLEEAGARIVEIDALPAHASFSGVGDLWPTWLTYRHASSSVSAGALYGDPATRARLKPEAIWEIEGALGAGDRAAISAAEFLAASARRSDLYEAIRGLFDRVDVLALPTAQLFPFDAQLTWPRDVAGRAMDTYHRWMEVSILATLINAPAIALPAGFGEAGLPIGVQLIGRNHDERGLLGAAERWERIQPHVPLPDLLAYLRD